MFSNFRLTTKRFVLISIIIYIVGTQNTLATFNETNNLLDCTYEQLEDLSDKQCRPLKVYNAYQVSLLSSDERYELARICACELSNLPWEEEFDGNEHLRRIYDMINSLLSSPQYGNNNNFNFDQQQQQQGQNNYPAYLWNDVDVIVEGISIQMSMRDYLAKKALKLLPASQLLEHSMHETAWRDINRICKLVAVDKRHLYGYMENLQRLSPVIFFKMLDMNEIINITYQSSKVCKLLLVQNLHMFRLKLSNYELMAFNLQQVTKLTAHNEELNSLNSIQDQESFSLDENEQYNIDTKLRHASVSLMKCDHWQRERLTLNELGKKCPMMISNDLPRDLLKSTLTKRTDLILFCACQLLLHKNNWAKLINEDKNVELMSKTLINYMNQIRFPDLQTVPIWAFHQWFETTLKRFEESRKLSIKEIIKFKHGSQDPKEAINSKTMDEHEALELLRRGCNAIVFNMGKNYKQLSEIKIIQYLDNLQYISVDPQFVFHLTLQDGNLFKLYALSKLCKPIIK